MIDGELIGWITLAFATAAVLFAQWQYRRDICWLRRHTSRFLNQTSNESDGRAATASPETGLVHTTIPTAQDRNNEVYKTTKELSSLTGVDEAELVKLFEDEEIRGVNVVEGWLARESDVREHLRTSAVAGSAPCAPTPSAEPRSTGSIG